MSDQPKEQEMNNMQLMAIIMGIDAESDDEALARLRAKLVGN